MILLTAILLLVSLAAGFFYNAKKPRRWLRIAGALIAIASFAVLFGWARGFDSTKFRSEYSTHLFKTDMAVATPEGYTLTLAIGEISESSERWYFKSLGKISAFKMVSPLGLNLEGDFPPDQEKVYQKGILRVVELQKYGIDVTLGWDDAGGEFLNVRNHSIKRKYLRTFDSYYGVFPTASCEFSASRLFMSGGFEGNGHNLFGMPFGKTGFLIVQAEGNGEEEEFNVKTLFENLKSFENPYRNSGNIESFSAARELLVRGACFPRRNKGVIELLKELSPVSAALFFLVALGVFLTWVNRTSPGLLVGIFVALLVICAVSNLEFKRTASSLDTGGGKGLYTAIALSSSPLWENSAANLLSQESNTEMGIENLIPLVESLHTSKTSGR